MKRQTLKNQWQSVCEEYLRRFCEIMGFDYKDAHWPGEYIGTTVAFPGGEAFSIHDIRYVVDNNLDRDTIMAWWNYTYDIHCLQMEYDAMIGRGELHSINLEHWCKGAPKPYTEEEIKLRKASIENMRQMREKFCKEMEELNRDSNIY